MSLIADALKRAQRGGIGRRLPLPSMGSPRSQKGAPASPARRMLFLVGFMAAGGAIFIGGISLLTPSRKGASLRVAQPPPLILEETRPTSEVAQKNTEPQPKEARPKPKDDSTITDVLAALQSQPEDEPRLTKPREARAGEPQTPKKSDSRREIALQRAKEALEDNTPPARPGGASAAPSPPAASAPAPGSAPGTAVAKAEPTRAAPAPPPAMLEVHSSGKDAMRFFTEGVRYQREGRYAQAIEAYEKTVSTDPGYLEAYNNLGVLLKETGRLDQAVEALQRALALDPKYEKALNNLGVARYLKGQYEEAVSLFRRAILINPENVESYTNLGIIYLLAERLEEARSAFERALQLDPKHAETHYNLALLYERRGIWPKALAHYRRFIELAGPKHAASVAKVQERLRILAERR